MRRPIILLIKAYQLALSPLFGRCCRFEPSCSRYAMEAVERHGALRGSYLALLRIGRCHPWHEGGEDPVPALPAHGGRGGRENTFARRDAAQSSSS